MHQQARSPLPEAPVRRVYADQPSPTAVPTKQDIINKYPHADILSRVWILESAQGKAVKGYHRGCEAKGESNEFGYGVWSKICFSTFEESVQTISAWFTKKLQDHTLAEALCTYNVGKNTNECEYAQNFLNH